MTMIAIDIMMKNRRRIFFNNLYCEDVHKYNKVWEKKVNIKALTEKFKKDIFQLNYIVV